MDMMDFMLGRASAGAAPTPEPEMVPLCALPDNEKGFFYRADKTSVTPIESAEPDSIVYLGTAVGQSGTITIYNLRKSSGASGHIVLSREYEEGDTASFKVPKGAVIAGKYV